MNPNNRCYVARKEETFFSGLMATHPPANKVTHMETGPTNYTHVRTPSLNNTTSYSYD
jgi:hypothetical protein